MNQVSTNLTLLYRLFIPVFFTVFVGATTVFLWMHPQQYYGGLRGDYLRIGVTVLFVLGLLLFAFSVWRLRRVEMSKEWIYVTDYFRQARYPWDNVDFVKETPIGIFTIVSIYLSNPGRFGRRITFLASVSRWRIFKEEFPDRLADLLRR